MEISRDALAQKSSVEKNHSELLVHSEQQPAGTRAEVTQEPFDVPIAGTSQLALINT